MTLGAQFFKGEFMFISKIYAVVGGQKEDGILTINGLPMVCTTKAMSEVFEKEAEIIAQKTGHRVCLVEFMSVDILADFGGPNDVTKN